MKSDATFDKIAVRLTKVTEEERKLQVIYKFVIKVNGTPTKTWMLDLKALKLYVGDDAADCTLIVEDEDMFNLGSGALSTEQALAQNKLDLEGKIELALKLEPYVSSL